MKTKSITFHNPAVAIPVTRQQLIALGIPATALEAGEHRGTLTHRGPWHFPVSFRALCTSSTFDDSKGYTVTTSTTLHGVRTLSKVRESGYALEGRVSVNGKTVRGFTSSQLFELEDGKLVSIATIHACH